jgi:hypothetical protein
MRLVSSSDIIGQTARFAVEQHPYHAPEGLFELVQVALAACRRDFGDGVQALPMCRFETSHAVRKWLGVAIGDHPILKAWNTPKRGDARIVMVSAFSGRPLPEYDFIDIDALLMNIALGAWRASAEFEKAPIDDEPIAVGRRG